MSKAPSPVLRSTQYAIRKPMFGLSQQQRDETPEADRSVMPYFAHEHLLGLGQFDVIVALPSYRNASTIAGVATAAGEALARDFAGMRGLVLNVDGQSHEGTAFIFNSVPMPEGVGHATIPYLATPGRGNALRIVAEAAELVGARLVVLLDPDLQTLDPSWVRRLAQPVLDGTAEMVTPVYNYRPFEDLPFRLLVGPLMAPLVDGDWNAPAATDRAISGDIVRAMRAEMPNNSAVYGEGVDLWLSYSNLRRGRKLAQVGRWDRDRYARDPAVPLGPDFAQLVATAFDLLNEPDSGNTLTAPPILADEETGAELEVLETTLAALIARFKKGAVDAGALWESVLAPDDLQAVQQLAAASYKGEAALGFRFPPELWVSIVYSWRDAYRATDMTLQTLLSGLGPLFNGFAASFVASVRADASAEGPLLQSLHDLFKAARG